MPVEIKELHIKAIVASGDKDKKTAVNQPADMAKLKKEMVKEITEKVLRILEQKNER